MAKNKFAIKALNQKDEPILVTLELNIANMDIDIKSFPIATKADKEVDDMISKWNAGESIEFPESTKSEKRNFTDEALLPDDIKVDGISGAIRQLQNEWSYLLLNAKLFEQFNTELDIIKQKAGEVKAFSHELFDEAKEFWEKILEYKKEREISQEKLNYFKEEINGVFDHLKHLKESMLKEKDEVSEKIKVEFSEALTVIESKIEEQGVHFKTLLDELREMQTKLRSQDVKRDIKNILFENIQNTYDKVRSKRDQIVGNANDARLDGLKIVLTRLQKTLDLDKKDLDFNLKKMNSVNNKLEQQLREAKINVLKDRIASKEEKLADITKTMSKLSRKASQVKEEIEGEVKELAEEVKVKSKEVVKEAKKELKEAANTLGDFFDKLADKLDDADTKSSPSPTTPDTPTTKEDPSTGE